MIASTFGNLHVATQASATSAYMSATALLQKAATVGAAAITGPIGPQQRVTGHVNHVTHHLGSGEFGIGTVSQLDPVVAVPDNNYMRTTFKGDRLTRDFLGLTADATGGAVDVSTNVKDMLTFAGGVEYHQPHRQHHHHALLKPQQGFGFLGTTTAPETWWNC